MIQNNNLIVIKVNNFSFRLASNLIDDKKVSQRLGRNSNSINILKNKDLCINEFVKIPKTPFSKIRLSNSLKGLVNKAKRQVFIPAVCIGDAYLAVYELNFMKIQKKQCPFYKNTV